MKKIIIILSVVCFVGLTGCVGKVKPISANVSTSELNKETQDLTESIQTATSGVEIDHGTKIEIFAFIQSQIDSLNETDMSFDKKEYLADGIWKKAEMKFNITESNVMLIMSDVDLIEKYYMDLETDGTLKNSTDDKVVVARFRENELTNYQYCVKNGYQDIVTKLKKEGRVFSVPNGTRIKIVHFGLSIAELELLDGENKGETVYVFNNQIEVK